MAAGPRRKNRTRAGVPLSFDILVPNSSAARRQLALQMQEMWRRVGVAVTVTAVDFPIFQERLSRGRFDSYVGAWLDEPEPTQPGRSMDAIGVGRRSTTGTTRTLASTRFSLRPRARSMWRAPVACIARPWTPSMPTRRAIFLYAPANIAVVSRRIEGVDVNPYSWASGLPAWRAVR